MNTMTVLLSATFALLLAAVVISFQGMTDGVKNAPKDELARLRIQVDQLRVEQGRLRAEKDLQQLRTTPEAAAPTSSEVDRMKAELEAKEAELSALAADKETAEKKAETFRDEAGLIGQRELEKGDNVLRRARLIRDALLIGRVKQYVVDPAAGGFAVIDVAMAEHVQVGTILAIRRNTGILGKVKITDISAEGAIGNPMAGFGPVEPKEGDELIIPPSV